MRRLNLNLSRRTPATTLDRQCMIPLTPAKQIMGNPVRKHITIKIWSQPPPAIHVSLRLLVELYFAMLCLQLYYLIIFRSSGLVTCDCSRLKEVGLESTFVLMTVQVLRCYTWLALWVKKQVSSGELAPK